MNQQKPDKHKSSRQDMDSVTSTKADILIIDDSPDSLGSLSRLLHYKGYEVNVLADAHQALQVARATLPSLIILDIRMPGLDGFEICRRLKADEKTQHIPIIFISVLDDIEEKITALTLGGADYITKPFQAREVLARVQTHVTVHNLQQALQEKNLQLEQQITERKQAEQALKQYHDQLEELVAERTQELKKEIAEHKQTEIALKRQVQVNATISELSKALISPTSLEDLSNLILDHAKQLTHSTFGYVGYLDPETGYLVCPTMTRGIWKTCQVPDKDIVFKEFGGLWGWVLENRQPILTNQPAEDPRSSGTPPGHLPVERFLSVPSLVEEKLVGQIALANPNRDYTTEDLMVIQRLASLYALAIQRHWSQETLSQQAKELARSNAELERFTYIASHHLREPLRMVSLYTQLLAKNYHGKLDAEADAFIKYAVNGTRQMKQLLDDLLTYIEIDAQDIRLAPIDCNELISYTLKRQDVTITKNAVVVSRDRLPVVMADAEQLGLVFFNLIDNALKFRNDRAPRLHITAERLAPSQGKPNQAMWRFAIRDNGIGIAPKYTQRIFKAFERLHTQDAYPGTGIGLAICKKVVERHGGEIWVESQPGVGSTFYFTLPAKQARP